MARIEVLESRQAAPSQQLTGSMDSSIVIRTYTIKDDIVTFQAGGGIVADSRPDAEYEETLDKVKALCTALSPDGSRP